MRIRIWKTIVNHNFIFVHSVPVYHAHKLLNLTIAHAGFLLLTLLTIKIWVLMWLNIVINCLFKSLCSVQVVGRMRRGQMAGLQSLVTVNAQPSLSTRFSWQRQAVKSSRVAWRIMAVLTSCPKCKWWSYQPYSAVEDTTAPPHITNQPITQWFSVGQEMIGHMAVTVDLGRRWRFVNFWMCHLKVTLISLDLSKFKGTGL